MQVERKKGKVSLFIKVFSICLIFIIVPMLINLFYSTRLSSQALENEVDSSLSSVALEKKKEVDLVFEAQYALSEAWVEDLFAIQFFEELKETNEMDEIKLAQLSKHLEERFAKADGLYENIFFTYEDKVLIDGIGGNSVGVEMDQEREYYYYEQLKNPGVTTGRYMISPITERPVIPIINSIVDKSTNQVISALVIPIDVNKLTESLVQNELSDQMGTMILDPNGLVIAADKDELALNLNFSEEADLQSFFKEMSENIMGSGKFHLNGEEYIAAYHKHEIHGLYILTYMPVAQYMSKVDNLKWGIMTALVITVLLSSMVIYFAMRRMVRPITVVAERAEQIASGDLLVEPIQIRTKDEIGHLARSFNVMLENLQSMVKQVSHTAQRVAASAEEFLATAQHSSEVSKQVAEAIEEVAAGTEEQSRNTNYSSEMINEVSKVVLNLSKNAQKAAASAALATEKANSGAITVDASVNEIDGMNRHIQQMAEKMKRLGERSKEIGQIVAVITDIAEQTNLLALNAAIEASRAGENGRGFAVVAEEVRKLAEQSKESSEQIGGLITGILEETEETVKAMDEMVNQSSQGIEVIRSIDRTFDEIERAVKDVRAEIEGVAKAGEEIEAAMEQIATNINQINRISAETAAQAQQVSSATEEQLASAEEIADTSKSMAEMADELQSLVQKFKLK